MREFGINLIVGIVCAYIAYQLGAWRERRWFAGFEKRAKNFREELSKLKRRSTDETFSER